MELAGQAARDKGVVVAVGAVGLNIPRKAYYEKELGLIVSRSYGPGRYDPAYEEGGQDYPYPYVRWTEQRNMASFVELLARDQVRVQPLISHRFALDEAHRAYALIGGQESEPYLGIVLQYPQQVDLTSRVRVTPAGVAAPLRPQEPGVRLGVLGAGNYANATLLPVVAGLPGLDLIGIASGRGLSARTTADRFKFAFCTTEAEELLSNPQINTVAILTRHHQHAAQVIAALEAGKHVFVEKPLCLSDNELDDIIAAYEAAHKPASATVEAAAPMLMVGFNRRFAPFIMILKRHLRDVAAPLMIHCRVNAGAIPPTHWLHDPAQGGGRLVGEGCHFIDLVCFLAGDVPQRVTARSVARLAASAGDPQDSFSLTVEFANGSLGSLLYTSGGDRRSGKERVEVFGGGISAEMDDYRRVEIFHGGTIERHKARLRQDKGHGGEWAAIVAHLTGEAPPPIPFVDLVRSTRTTLAAQRSLQTGEPVVLKWPGQ